MKTDGQVSGAVEKAAVKERPAALTLKQFLESKRASFEELLPTKKQADRFMRILIALPIMNPQIAGCTFESILKSAILCARDGLEPDGRHAALVPFTVGGALTATYMPMVHGIIRKAFETGEFKTVAARAVFENDDFTYQYDFDTSFRHVPSEGERGKLKGVYAYYVLLKGGRDFIYMSAKDCEEHGKRFSKSYQKDDSPWKKFAEEMYLKTVIKKVLHFSPTTIDMPDEEYEEGMRNVTPSPRVLDVTGLKETAQDAAVPATAESQGAQAEKAS
jgi:recombination protein RecT